MDATAAVVPPSSSDSCENLVFFLRHLRGKSSEGKWWLRAGRCRTSGAGGDLGVQGTRPPMTYGVRCATRICCSLSGASSAKTAVTSAGTSIGVLPSFPKFRPVSLSSAQFLQVPFSFLKFHTVSLSSVLVRSATRKAHGYIAKSTQTLLDDSTAGLMLGSGAQNCIPESIKQYS